MKKVTVKELEQDIKDLKDYCGSLQKELESLTKDVESLHDAALKAVLLLKENQAFTQRLANTVILIADHNKLTLFPIQGES